MTAYSPIPESGMLSIQLPLGNHRLSLYHPNYVFEDLRVHRKSFNEVKTYLQPFDVHGSMRGPFLSGNENVSWIALKKKVYHEVKIHIYIHTDPLFFFFFFKKKKNPLVFISKE
ncbi:hypothetical protein HMI54_013384 [Coelomomyces lativittatus]|nr:hypothetical protein HMI54_013384 [Coelomomyces lativittatus]